MIGKPIPSGWKRPFRSEMTSPTFNDTGRYSLLEGGYKVVDGICYVDMVLQLNWVITPVAYTNDVISYNGTRISGFPTPKNYYNANFAVSFLLKNTGYHIAWYDKKGEGDATLYQEPNYGGEVTLGLISRVTVSESDVTNHNICVHVTGEYEV